MQAAMQLVRRITASLNQGAHYLPLLLIRSIMAWEFYYAGMAKLHGENWFATTYKDFPWPFSLVSPDISWALATWFELLGALALLLGLFTRFAAFSLIVLSAVAIAAVHWPDSWSSLAELWRGYAISDDGYGNYKLPLLFIIMLLALVFSGGGRLSLDHLLWRWVGGKSETPEADVFLSAALALAILGVPLSLFWSPPGLMLLGFAAVLVVASLFRSSRH